MIPEDIRAGACHWLSKSGTFSQYRAELQALAPLHSKSEVAEFYSFLRDNAERFESEWRGEFCAIFGVGDGDLPAIDDADRWGGRLHTLVERGDEEGVRAFIDRIGVGSWDFSPEEGEPEIEIYPIDDADETGDTPAVKARRLGHTGIASFLESVKEEVVGRYRRKWTAAYGKGG